MLADFQEKHFENWLAKLKKLCSGFTEATDLPVYLGNRPTGSGASAVLEIEPQCLTDKGERIPVEGFFQIRIPAQKSETRVSDLTIDSPEIRIHKLTYAVHCMLFEQKWTNKTISILDTHFEYSENDDTITSIIKFKEELR